MDGRLLIILAAMLWGTTGTSQALAPAAATPLAIGALRLLIGGAALIIVALRSGHLHWDRRWLHWVTLLACITTALYQITFFAGVALAGVAIGTLIGLGSAPIFAGLLGALFRNETLSRRWWVATLLAIGGCGLLASAGDDTAVVRLPGIVLSLGAGLSYAVFALVSKQLLEEFHANAVMAVSFSGGALLLLPTFLVVDWKWALTPNGLLVLLHLGLIATGLAYYLFGRGLRTVSVAVAGTLSLVEPLMATTLGVLLLGERLSMAGIAGVALLFIGLMVLILPTQPALER